MVVEISQYCNDWFMVNAGDAEIDRKPLSPSSLAFSFQDIKKIIEDKGSGTMARDFVVAICKTQQHKNGQLFSWTFKKRRI